MSKKIQRLWSKKDVESALREAYPLAFHEDMKPCYVSFKMTGKIDLASQSEWSKSFATAYMMSDTFAEYLQHFIAQAMPAFSTNDAKHALEGFRFKVQTITAKSCATLQAAQDFLINNPDSSKWLTLILFAHSRAISVTASSAFASNEWSEYSLLIMQLEGAFVRGDGPTLISILAHDMKKFSADFSEVVARNSPIALATMVGLDEKAVFFNGT